MASGIGANVVTGDVAMSCLEHRKASVGREVKDQNGCLADETGSTAQCFVVAT